MFKVTPFHLVKASPWPFIMGFMGFVLTFGLILKLNMKVSYMMFFGFFGILIMMWFWLSDVMYENLSGWHNYYMMMVLRCGMILFILSEVLFFFSFFWSYFYVLFNPLTWKVNSEWPPIVGYDAWGVPFLNTVLLVSSGVMLTWAHHSLLNEEEKIFMWFKFSFLCTLMYGWLFVLFQGYEYVENCFSLDCSIFGSVFYMLTGFHGLHVLIGIIMLSICYVRFLFHHFNAENHNHLLVSSWYWHFVDVVWLFLFSFVYVGCM